ncbi:MAG TPA: hypothetical protein VED37_16130 [Ktedonobacteraceae bacterium]|nr:hypothetical protein [Ktedonobacteraceae bacterium]
MPINADSSTCSGFSQTTRIPVGADVSCASPMMKCNDRNRSENVGAQFIGAPPIHRPGVGGCGIARRMFWGRGPMNRRWARSIGPYEIPDFGL